MSLAVVVNIRNRFLKVSVGLHGWLNRFFANGLLVVVSINQCANDVIGCGGENQSALRSLLVSVGLHRSLWEVSAGLHGWLTQ